MRLLGYLLDHILDSMIISLMTTVLYIIICVINMVYYEPVKTTINALGLAPVIIDVVV